MATSGLEKEVNAKVTLNYKPIMNNLLSYAYSKVPFTEADISVKDVIEHSLARQTVRG